MTVRLNFVSGFVLDALPGWAEVIGLPIQERKRALADPAVRERMNQGATSEAAGVFRAIANWENMTIVETFSEETRSFAGRNLGEVAAELGKSPFDTMLDLALLDDLKTSFMPRTPGDDDESWKLRAEVWQDPRSIVGASDAGAHLDMINTFLFTTAMLEAVRERDLVGLEEAVHQLTDVPARSYGIRERGRLAEGWRADVTVFDPDRVGPTEIYTREDLPAGAGRLYADAHGIEHVLVNGQEIVCRGEFTDTYPGTLLRSGRDTETVEIPGAPAT
jgi:N-acyl-D-aspartate/D-glutamate deacylase